MPELSEAERNFLGIVFEKTNGRAWEPKDTTHPFFDRAIAAGFLRRADGRCGFERLKDAMIDWTPAGRAAFQGEPRHEQ